MRSTEKIPAGERPVRPEAVFQEALSRHRNGDIALAEAFYKQVLTLQPRHAGALHLLGVLTLQKGAVQQACELLGQSIRADGQIPQVHLDLGNALHAAQRFEQALTSYERAVALKADFLEARFNRVLVLQQLQRFEQAWRGCEEVLALQPNFVNALFTRGALLGSLQRYEEALAAYDRCLQLAPGHADAHNNRGALLLGMQRPEEALAAFDAAIRLAEHSPGAMTNRGVALSRLNRLEEAERAFALATTLEPHNHEAHLSRANVLRKLQRTEESLQCLDTVIKLRPDGADALLSRAETLTELSRYAEAAGCIIKLATLLPQKDYAIGLRVYLQSVLCDWEGYSANARQLVEAVRAGKRAAYPFNFLSVSDSAAAQLRCARTFVKERYPAAAPLYQGESYQHNRIRVAYLSADLRDHPVATLLAGVLELHDRERFELIGLALRPAEDSAMGRRIRAVFDEFIQVDQLPAAEIASLIRAREVDVLIDLMGFTSFCRTEVLALRPAPAQVSWLGFPGTLGASYIDYLLADSFVVPRSRCADYAEKIVWMPDCFQPNDRLQQLAHGLPVRSDYGLPETGVVFCSFNNQYKLTPGLFEVWMRVLREAPASVLWIFTDEQTAFENLCREAIRHGVEPGRLVAAARVPYAEHLARMHCADLYLDTFPFNGGTSTSDALRAGLPVLTLTGEAFAARMAGSLLNTLGLTELVTSNIDAYAKIAIELGRNPTALSDLRLRVTTSAARSALFDTGRFCRHLERAFSFMRERSQRREPPASFCVAPLEAQSACSLIDG